MCAVMFVIGFLNNVIINSVIDVQKYKKIIKLSGSDIYIVFVIYWLVNYCFKFIRFICNFMLTCSKRLANALKVKKLQRLVYLSDNLRSSASTWFWFFLANAHSR